MNKEELKDTLGFLFNPDLRLYIQVYVTTVGGTLKLFNIQRDDLGDLLGMFLTSLQKRLIDDDFTLEDYSIGHNFNDTIYRFDLSDEDRTIEMQNLIQMSTIIDPENFNTSENDIEEINGIYILINSSNNQSVSLYKHIMNIDKTYVNAKCCYIVKSNDQYKRLRKTLLRITPSFQMFQVNGEIFMTDMKLLERAFNLKAILQREVLQNIQTIRNKGLISNEDFLQRVCAKPLFCKKLKHALSKSKVITKDIANEEIIRFAESQSLLKFHFSADKTMFDIRSKAEAERFIKLLDDDFLYSLLSKTDYDSSNKDLLN